MNKNIRTLNASCLCNGVSMKITGEFRPVINCHCVQCTKTHGNFAAYTSVLENNIEYKSKKTLKWYKSSKFAKRGFCFFCGASFFYKRLASKNISISAGMLNNPTKLKTLSNIFIKGKLDFYKLDKRLNSFNKYSK